LDEIDATGEQDNEFLARGVRALTVEARLRNHAPASADDLLLVHTSVAEVGRLRFTFAYEIRRESDAGLIVFSYFNPVMRMGIEKFAARAAEVGVDGTLITDLPVEEAREYLDHMRQKNLATIFLAAPTSTDERLKSIAEVSSGFVYAVSRTGVTGARKELSEDAQKLVRRLRKFTKLPIAVGFGISEAAQFAAVGEYADAAVVGSAIVQVIERSPGTEAKAVAEFIEAVVGRRSLVVGH